MVCGMSWSTDSFRVVQQDRRSISLDLAVLSAEGQIVRFGFVGYESRKCMHHACGFLKNGPGNRSCAVALSYFDRPDERIMYLAYLRLGAEGQVMSCVLLDGTRRGQNRACVLARRTFGVAEEQSMGSALLYFDRPEEHIIYHWFEISRVQKNRSVVGGCSS